MTRSDCQPVPVQRAATTPHPFCGPESLQYSGFPVYIVGEIPGGRHAASPERERERAWASMALILWLQVRRQPRIPLQPPPHVSTPPLITSNSIRFTRVDCRFRLRSHQCGLRVRSNALAYPTGGPRATCHLGGIMGPVDLNVSETKPAPCARLRGSNWEWRAEKKSWTGLARMRGAGNSA